MRAATKLQAQFASRIRADHAAHELQAAKSLRRMHRAENRVEEAARLVRHQAEQRLVAEQQAAASRDVGWEDGLELPGLGTRVHVIGPCGSEEKLQVE